MSSKTSSRTHRSFHSLLKMFRFRVIFLRFRFADAFLKRKSMKIFAQRRHYELVIGEQWVCSLIPEKRIWMHLVARLLASYVTPDSLHIFQMNSEHFASRFKWRRIFIVAHIIRQTFASSLARYENYETIVLISSTTKTSSLKRF